MAETTLAYEVTVNDEDPVICGAPELDVLSAMLTAVKERGGADLSVAGLVVKEGGEHQHWRWLSKPLGVGDQITVRIVEDAACIPPETKESIDPGTRG